MKTSDGAEIIPAILEPSLQAIEEKLLRVRGAVRAVQLDVVDGVFAPHKTWPYESAREREEFQRIVLEQQGLPLWADFDFEVDLMVARVKEFAVQWISAGASRIVLHLESADILDALHALRQAMRSLHASGETNIFPVQVGVAISSTASPEDVAPFEGLYDFVQVMGIAHAGAQGQPFDERAIALVSQLRATDAHLTIQVDGGVSKENARALAEAGASRLIVGSTIFGSENPKATLEELQHLANV